MIKNNIEPMFKIGDRFLQTGNGRDEIEMTIVDINIAQYPYYWVRYVDTDDSGYIFYNLWRESDIIEFLDDKPGMDVRWSKL